MNYIFRKSEDSDISSIMQIINEAKEYLKANGVDQWQDGYPNAEVIEGDIKKGISYVALLEGKIVGTVVLSFEPEESYLNVIGGCWKKEGSYGTIHRIAVNGLFRGTGLSAFIMEKAERLCAEKGVYILRTDTHKDNTAMNKMLTGRGFEYCGIIQLCYGGGERRAYKKLLKENKKIL